MESKAVRKKCETAMGAPLLLLQRFHRKHSKIYLLPLLYMSVCMSARNNGRYAAQILSIFDAEKFY